MTEPQACSFSGCEQAAAAPLDTRAFCAEHFATACDERLDGYRRQLEQRPFAETTVESLAHFLAECTRQAAQLADRKMEMGGEDRSRLLQILTRAAELGRHLRRSPRTLATIPIWVRREGPGRTWEEETETQMLSRYGVALECRHFVESGGTLSIVRRDNGQRINARVAYCRYTATGHREVGLEFINCDNFWNLDWAAPDTRPSEPEGSAETPQAVQDHAAPSAAQTSRKRRSQAHVVELLANQERQLWDAVKNKDTHRLETLLADEFLWVSPEGLQMKSRDPANLPDRIFLAFSPEDLAVTRINKATALVSYRAAEPCPPGQDESSPRHIYHTSIWVNRGGQWQIVLHQQTPTTEAAVQSAVNSR